MKNKKLAAFFVAYIILAYGLAVYLGWKWLVIPFFDVNQLPYWAAVIMGFVIKVFIPSPKQSPGRSRDEIIAGFIGAPIGVIFLLWALGLIVPIFT